LPEELRKRSPRTIAALAEVHETFRRYLYLPDRAVVEIPLAVYVAHRLPGDPPWGFAVGPPSGGKTEVLQALAVMPDVHRLSGLTAQTFASGMKDRGKARGHASLLKRLDEWGKTF